MDYVDFLHLFYSVPYIKFFIFPYYDIRQRCRSYSNNRNHLDV